MMRRAEGWDKRLRELLDSKRDVPFAWGSNDCCTFAIEDYRAIMIEDPPGLPEWSDLSTAQALVASKALPGWLTEICGDPIEGYAYARRGDLVLIGGVFKDTPWGEPVGIVAGTMIAVLSLSGLAFLPLARGTLTWRIGE